MTLLLERGAEVDAAFGPTRMTALHMPASWNGVEIVEALLAAGADPTVADVNGLGPLHLAAVFGSVGSVRAIIATGRCSVDAVAATALGEIRLLDAALQCDDGAVALDMWRLVRDECGASTDYLRQLRLWPEPHPAQLVPPLLGWLLELRRRGAPDGTELALEKAQLLLAAGADPNAACPAGRTALWFAQSPEMTALLCRAGANPSARADPALLAKAAAHETAGEYADTVLEITKRLGVMAYPVADGEGPDAKTAARGMAEIVLSYKVVARTAPPRASTSSPPPADLAAGALAAWGARRHAAGRRPGPGRGRSGGDADRARRIGGRRRRTGDCRVRV